MKSSLVTKINTRIVISVAFSVLIMGIFDFFHSKNQIEEKLDESLTDISQRLGKSLLTLVWSLDMEAVEAVIETEMFNKNIMAIVVRDAPSGNIIIAKIRDKDWKVVAMPPSVVIGSNKLREKILVFNETEIGTVTIYMVDTVMLDQLVSSSTGLLVRMIMVVFLIITVLLIFLTKSVSRPVQELSQLCEKIVQGDFDREIDISRTDEIGSLAKSFSQMREAVKEKIVTLNEEILERKNSERELERLRNLLGNIIDSMPSIVVGVDWECKVTQWNLEAVKLTGLSAEDARDRKLTEVLPFLKKVIGLIDLAVQEHKAQKDIRVKCVINKTERIVDIAVYPLSTHDMEGAVVRVDDETERVRLEEVMIQTEKMMSVGGLAAGMAHEINNPLAGVMQSVQVIQNRLSPELKKNRSVASECHVDMESIHSYMEKRDILRLFVSIVDSGKRAARIVDNMLTFSRKSTSTFVSCNMKDLLDKTIELAANDYDLKKRYDFRRIKIVKEYAKEVSDVRCDPSTIQQVFFNLLKNSAQAIADKNNQVTTLWEEMTPEIVLRVEQDDDKVMIVFQDNGIGMDEKKRNRIFEPFYTTKPVGVGTGLGLSVSFFIVRDNHKGSIDVVSTPAEGSQFTVTLPV